MHPLLATLFVTLTLSLNCFVGSQKLSDFNVTDLYGNNVFLSKYAGQVVLIVNVASF